jgi:hypothetical protein
MIEELDGRGKSEDGRIDGRWKTENARRKREEGRGKREMCLRSSIFDL